MNVLLVKAAEHQFGAAIVSLKCVRYNLAEYQMNVLRIGRYNHPQVVRWLIFLNFAVRAPIRYSLIRFLTPLDQEKLSPLFCL